MERNALYFMSEILKQKADSNNSIDVSKLSTDMYFISTNKNGNKIVKKFLKK